MLITQRVNGQEWQRYFSIANWPTNEYQYACTPPNLGIPELCQREAGEAQTIGLAAHMTGVVQYTTVFSRVQSTVLPIKLPNILRELKKNDDIKTLRNLSSNISNCGILSAESKRYRTAARPLCHLNQLNRPENIPGLWTCLMCVLYSAKQFFLHLSEVMCIQCSVIPGAGVWTSIHSHN
jgi:hypothetical protein